MTSIPRLALRSRSAVTSPLGAYTLTLTLTGLTDLTVPQGGTLVSADTVGSAGQVLISNGPGWPATFGSIAAAGIVTATLPLTLTAVAGAYAGGTLLSTVHNLLCVQGQCHGDWIDAQLHA
jgi:hypothetical protein